MPRGRAPIRCGDRIFFQPGQRDDRFDRRAWRVLALQSTIEQRLIRIVSQVLMFPGAQSLDEKIGVKARHTCKYKDLAIARIDSDHGAALAFEGCFSSYLRIDINAEYQILAGRGELESSTCIIRPCTFTCTF